MHDDTMDHLFQTSWPCQLLLCKLFIYKGISTTEITILLSFKMALGEREQRPSPKVIVRATTFYGQRQPQWLMMSALWGFVSGWTRPIWPILVDHSQQPLGECNRPLGSPQKPLCSGGHEHNKIEESFNPAHVCLKRFISTDTVSLTLGLWP